MLRRLLPLLLATVSSSALAQGSTRSHLGISGTGALGLWVAADALEHDAHGSDAGVLLDLGWLGAKRLRFQGEIEFLRGTLTEFVELEDKEFHGAFFDLAASVSAVLLGGSESSRVAPYLLAGVGVHALSSTFGALALDRRYNANPFGVHAGAGLRIWLSASGRSGVFVEARRVVAESVNRSSLRVGGMAFFRDLVRRR